MTNVGHGHLLELQGVKIMMKYTIFFARPELKMKVSLGNYPSVPVCRVWQVHARDISRKNEKMGRMALHARDLAKFCHTL